MFLNVRLLGHDFDLFFDPDLDLDRYPFAYHGVTNMKRGITTFDAQMINRALEGNPGLLPIHQQHWFTGFCQDMAKQGLAVNMWGEVVGDLVVDTKKKKVDL